MLRIDRTYLNLILVLGIVTSLYLLSQNWKRQLVVREVEVYDTQILTSSEVKSLADIATGSPLYKLNLLKIEQRVERNPFVNQAMVVRTLPYDVTITVRERDPIALVATRSAVFSVDRQGIILPLPMKRKNNMPVITNVSDKLEVGDTARGTLKQAVDLIKDARNLGPSLSANIGEVRLDGGDLIAYTTASSLQIIVGKNDFHRKLLYLRKFLQEVAADGSPNYRYVDLRYKGQIVVGTGAVSPHSQLAMVRPAGKGN